MGSGRMKLYGLARSAELWAQSGPFCFYQILSQIHRPPGPPRSQEYNKTYYEYPMLLLRNVSVVFLSLSQKVYRTRYQN